MRTIEALVVYGAMLTHWNLLISIFGEEFLLCTISNPIEAFFLENILCPLDIFPFQDALKRAYLQPRRYQITGKTGYCRI